MTPSVIVVVYICKKIKTMLVLEPRICPKCHHLVMHGKGGFVYQEYCPSCPNCGYKSPSNSGILERIRQLFS